MENTDISSLFIWDRHCKNIRKIYGRIADNQLPGHVQLFLREPLKIISHGRIGQSTVVLLTTA